MNAQPETMQTRAYRDGALEAEGFPLADVSDYLARPDCVVWVDFRKPSVGELNELADELGLHELAIEDALKANQRPKLDRYDTHIFLSCRAVRIDLELGALEEDEVGAFAGNRWLVTVRHSDTFSMQPVIERWSRSRPHAVDGVGYLLYCLLDVVVDSYFDVADVFDDYFDEVSDGIFSERPIEPSRQQHWFQMRQALVRFHRLVGPTREAVRELGRGEGRLPDALYPYYEDLHDHVLRVSESAEALRDLISTIVETNLTLRDYRQNQIVKKVTSWAAIVAVPTLITGYYGMNVPYPGSGEAWGVVMSAALIAVLSGTLYLVFRRNDWL